MLGGELGERLGQDGHRAGHRGAQADGAGVAQADLVQLIRQAHFALQHGRGVVVKVLPLGGEDEAGPAALEETGAIVLFQLGDGAGEGLLGHAQLLSRARQAALLGGGLEIALSCQFRIASPSAFLGLPEIMHGVIPGMGGIERLYRLLGKEKALKMILCGEMISAKDALAAGLVTKLSEEKNSFGETMAFVRELLNGKSKLQISSIIETMNLAGEGVEDPSKGKFEAVISEAYGK